MPPLHIDFIFTAVILPFRCFSDTPHSIAQAICAVREACAAAQDAAVFFRPAHAPPRCAPLDGTVRMPEYRFFADFFFSNGAGSVTPDVAACRRRRAATPFAHRSDTAKMAARQVMRPCVRSGACAADAMQCAEYAGCRHAATSPATPDFSLKDAAPRRPFATDDALELSGYASALPCLLISSLPSAFAFASCEQFSLFSLCQRRSALLTLSD